LGVVNKERDVDVWVKKFEEMDTDNKGALEIKDMYIFREAEMVRREIVRQKLKDARRFRRRRFNFDAKKKFAPANRLASKALESVKKVGTSFPGRFGNRKWYSEPEKPPQKHIHTIENVVESIISEPVGEVEEVGEVEDVEEVSRTRIHTNPLYLLDEHHANAGNRTRERDGYAHEHTGSPP
jgi:hypothetical protein